MRRPGRLQRFGHSEGNVACAFRSAATLMLEISKRMGGGAEPGSHTMGCANVPFRAVDFVRAVKERGGKYDYLRKACHV